MTIRPSLNLHLISLGCPKNLVDSEKILGALGASDITISALPQDSDIIVINTCGFIKPALEETEDEIKKALQIAEIDNKKIFVFGCAVNRFGEQLRQRYPEINRWFKLEDKEKLLHTIEAEACNVESRLLTTHGYAYLKIAEGCSNHCSYCTIPSIKGEYNSFDFDTLIKEAVAVSKLGIKEIIVIAQDTTRYGTDRYSKPMLVPLVRAIARIPEIKWIRLMYAHPKSINEDILCEIESNKKVCKYIDIPIQHIADRILRLMNRDVTRKTIEEVIKRLKEIKGISLRTTVIAGFPTESDNEFKELFNFLENADFDWLGVFPYFCEKGTEAAHLQQLPEHTINQRYKKIIDLQKRIIEKKNAEKRGKVYRTLIHSQNGYYCGHTEFIAPDIDGQVLIRASNLKVGNFYDLRITRTEGCDLYVDS